MLIGVVSPLEVGITGSLRLMREGRTNEILPARPLVRAREGAYRCNIRRRRNAGHGKGIEAMCGGRELDLDYFVEWRQYLWRKPVENVLRFLGDLMGRRVLEIGGRSGRMACLFASLGANVTMLQKGDCAAAAAEVEKWQVSDRVSLLSTDGGFDKVADKVFDVVFTKSVLWSLPNLADFLDQIAGLLAPGGKVAFVENVHGGKLVAWIRAKVIHRKDFSYGVHYHGITRRQLDLFRARFAGVRVRQHRLFVYEILGHSRTSANVPEACGR